MLVRVRAGRLKEQPSRVDEMALGVKVLAVKSNDLSSIPGTHMAGEN